MTDYDIELRIQRLEMMFDEFKSMSPVDQSLGCGAAMEDEEPFQVIDGAGCDVIPGLFEIESITQKEIIELSDPTGVEFKYEIILSNTYYRVGGKTYSAPDKTVVTNGILCLQVDVTRAFPKVEYKIYETIGEMKSAEEDRKYYIHPLYTMFDGKAVVDWRKGNLAMGEF